MVSSNLSTCGLGTLRVSGEKVTGCLLDCAGGVVCEEEEDKGEGS
jgi:hypothetical protein